MSLLLCLWIFVFFFFKQKTAYEMRISDWSSDVCSSDLFDARLDHPRLGREVGAGGEIADQPEPGEQQRSRTLRANELARLVGPDAAEHQRIGGDLARLDAAADDHRIGLCREVERLLPFDREAVYRCPARRRGGDMSFPDLTAH